eukprot:g121.t1
MASSASPETELLANVATYAVCFLLGLIFATWNLRRVRIAHSVGFLTDLLSLGGGRSAQISIHRSSALELRVQELVSMMLPVRTADACSAEPTLALLREPSAPRAVTGLFGARRSGKTAWLHDVAVHCMLPRSRGGFNAARVVVIDVAGTFKRERVAEIGAGRWGLDAGVVVARVRVLRAFDAATVVRLLGGVGHSASALLIDSLSGAARSYAGRAGAGAAAGGSALRAAQQRAALLRALEFIHARVPCCTVFTELLPDSVPAGEGEAGASGGAGSHTAGAGAGAGADAGAGAGADADTYLDLRSLRQPYGLAGWCSHVLLLARLPARLAAPPLPDALVNHVFAAKLVAEQGAVLDHGAAMRAPSVGLGGGGGNGGAGSRPLQLWGGGDEQCLCMCTRWGLADYDIRAELLSLPNAAGERRGAGARPADPGAAHRLQLAEFAAGNGLMQLPAERRHVELLQDAVEAGAARRWRALQARRAELAAVPGQLGALRQQVAQLSAATAQLTQLAWETQCAQLVAMRAAQPQAQPEARSPDARQQDDKKK